MNMAPIRIQRKRVKGFNLQEVSLAANGLPAISVTRPGEFGNPFVIGSWYMIGTGKSGTFKWLRCIDKETAKQTGFTEITTIDMAIEWYERMLTLYPLTNTEIEKLKGKNLACFCKLSQKCHADTLLRLLTHKS